MNLCGWSLSSFAAVLGSKDATVLQAASARLKETLPEEPEHSKAQAWLRTLIEKGVPLREDRETPSEPNDGSLLTVQMETEVHVFAVYCIVRAIARDDYLDLASESSHWTHSAVTELYNDAASCGFTRSMDCCIEYHSWMSRLSNGSPLFGDDFRTQWSFYSYFRNQELAAMVPALQSADQFKRPLPEGFPDELTLSLKTALSDAGKEFNGELMRWFSQIQRAGQDAFILWW
jgi:hypothetical protein